MPDEGAGFDGDPMPEVEQYSNAIKGLRGLIDMDVGGIDTDKLRGLVSDAREYFLIVIKRRAYKTRIILGNVDQEHDLYANINDRGVRISRQDPNETGNRKDYFLNLFSDGVFEVTDYSLVPSDQQRKFDDNPKAFWGYVKMAAEDVLAVVENEDKE